MNLFNLLVQGPLGGVQKRNPNVVHAITTEAFIAADCGRLLPTAPCGAKHLYFVSDKDRRVLLWPIRAAGPATRCRECWVATGKKRPRTANGSVRQEPTEPNHTNPARSEQ